MTLRTLGGPAILLIWLYVMANVIIFGGELNWWWAGEAPRTGGGGDGRPEEPRRALQEVTRVREP